MVTREKVAETLLEVVDDLNRRLASDQRLERSTATVLSGENSRLDSLGLINFIVAVEQAIEDKFESTVSLTDDILLAATDGPLHTVGSLAGFIADQLKG